MYIDIAVRTALSRILSNLLHSRLAHALIELLFVVQVLMNSLVEYSKGGFIA